MTTAVPPPDDAASAYLARRQTLLGLSAGSIRTDVILRSYTDGNASVTAVWDLKTGNAELRAARAREIRDKLGIGPETPLIEIQTNFGIRNKEFDDVLLL